MAKIRVKFINQDFYLKNYLIVKKQIISDLLKEN